MFDFWITEITENTGYIKVDVTRAFNFHILRMEIIPNVMADKNCPFLIIPHVKSTSLCCIFWHFASLFLFLQRDRESLADMEARQAAERRRLIEKMQMEDDEEEATPN